MEIRKIKDEEHLSAANIVKYSFFNWADNDEHLERNLPLLTSKETFATFENNTMCSCATKFNFKQYIRTSLKEMGGISLVGTLPEHREKGHINNLILHLFNDMKENNQSVSMLTPFKESFYKKYGFVITNFNIRVKIPLGFIHHYFNKNIKNEYKESLITDLSNLKDEYTNFKKKVSVNTHGMVINDNRTDKQWEKLHKNVLAIIIKDKNDDIVAVAKYLKKGVFIDSTITAFEMCWLNEDARKALFCFFAKHKDQVNFIEMFLPYGFNFSKWFNNKVEKVIIEPNIPLMVRIIDVEKSNV